LYRDDVNFIENEDGTKTTFKQFALDLAIYAFYTSGDRQGSTRFFNCVPNTIRTHMFEMIDGAQSYSEYIRNVIDSLPATDEEIINFSR